MSNRVIAKFGFIAAMFVFASCHNDVPELPDSEEVQFCRYKDENNVSQCKSTYEISERDCISIKGVLFPASELKDCQKP